MDSVDIKQVFIEILLGVIHIDDYSALQETAAFQVMESYVRDECDFQLTIESSVMHFSDVSDLFYDTQRHCQHAESGTEAGFFRELLNQAIPKIERFLADSHRADGLSDVLMKKLSL